MKVKSITWAVVEGGTRAVGVGGGTLHGFDVRKQKSDAGTYAIMYRWHGRQRYMRIGDTQLLAPKEATKGQRSRCSRSLTAYRQRTSATRRGRREQSPSSSGAISTPATKDVCSGVASRRRPRPSKPSHRASRTGSNRSSALCR